MVFVANDILLFKFKSNTYFRTHTHQTDMRTAQRKGTQFNLHGINKTVEHIECVTAAFRIASKINAND